MILEPPHGESRWIPGAALRRCLTPAPVMLTELRRQKAQRLQPWDGCLLPRQWERLSPCNRSGSLL